MVMPVAMTMVVMVVAMVPMVVVVMAVVHMTMTAVMAAAAVHHPTAAAVAAAMAAAVTAGFSTRGERRQADNDCCGKGEDCSALEHFRGSLCSAEAHPRTRAPVSLKARPAAVLAITRWSNPAPGRLRPA
jgi:hypothetical protein